jgi:eukaryotic-like serine/threonine-protein kinase
MDDRIRRLAITVFVAMVAVGLVIGLVLGAAVARRKHALVDAHDGAPSASAAPLPPSPGAPALAEAMQALRAADTAAAEAALERAIALDPTFAPAHLELGLVRLTTGRSAQPHFTRANEHAKTLGERETKLLRALSPCAAKADGDMTDCIGQVRALLAGDFATDPRLHAITAWLLLGTGEPGEGLAVATRGLDIDPRFAFGWLTRGALEAFLGRDDDALASFEACSKQAPGSTACLRAKAHLYSHLGEPSSCERTARVLVDRSPSDAGAALVLADALASNRRPAAEVRAAIDRAVALASEPSRAALRARLEGALAAREGDLRRAIIKYEVALGALSYDSDSRRYRTILWPLLELLHETGDDERAAEIATQVQKRSPSDGGADALAPLSAVLHPVPMIVAARYRAKALDDDARKRALEMFARSAAGPHGRAQLPAIWIAAWGATAETKQQADDAFARLRAENVGTTWYEPGVPRLRGRVARLAGRLDEAIEDLEPASRSCLALSAPTADIAASYELGLALEAKGDDAGACTAYRSVVELWGSAKPLPLTAKRAKKRRAAIGCKSGK